MRENMASGDLELNVCIDKREGWRLESFFFRQSNMERNVEGLKLKGNH
jgi:hypothetical protein